MALNACEMWSNGIKVSFFSKKITKNRPAAGGFAPTPVCDTFELQYTFLLKHVSQSRHFCILSISLSPLS